MRAIILRTYVVAVALLLVVTAAWCEPRITMELKDKSVGEAVRAIFKQAGERCVIDGELTGEFASISFKDVPLRSALRAVLRDSDFTFEVRNGLYVIQPKPADSLKPIVAPPPAKDPPAATPVAAKKKAATPGRAVNRVTYVTKQPRVARSTQAPVAQPKWTSRAPLPSSASLRRTPNYAPARVIRGRSYSYAPRVYVRGSQVCGPSG